METVSVRPRCARGFPPPPTAAARVPQHREEPVQRQRRTGRGRHPQAQPRWRKTPAAAGPGSTPDGKAWLPATDCVAVPGSCLGPRLLLRRHLREVDVFQRLGVFGELRHRERLAPAPSTTPLFAPCRRLSSLRDQRIFPQSEALPRQKVFQALARHGQSDAQLAPPLSAMLSPPTMRPWSTITMRSE